MKAEPYEMRVSNIIYKGVKYTIEGREKIDDFISTIPPSGYLFKIYNEISSNGTVKAEIVIIFRKAVL
ncbi:MAG: hypothetical protein QXM68_01250 [Candidatus Aenigmatarchaeota archaeon]|nr:hypothetical protein [Candidatus Aenigmarchaeota archaeon]